MSKVRHVAVGLLAVAAVSGLVLLFVRGVAVDRGPNHIGVGFNTWVGYGPFYIAQERGYFSEEGLRVDLQRIEGTGERRAALAAGRLDAMGSTIDDLVVSASQGVPARLVLALDESAGADGILVAESISGAKDLKGARIAVQPGFVNHFFLLFVLSQNGIKASDVHVVPMEPDKAAAAFVAKEVDVAVTWEPHLTAVKENRPDGKVLLTSSDFPGLIVDILVFRRDFVEEHPDTVRSFVRAWYRAVQFLGENPEEGRRIIASAFNLDRSEVAEMLSGVRLFGEEENAAYFNRANKVNVYGVAQAAARLWEEAGIIPNRPDVDQLIDERLFSTQRP